MLIMAVKMFIDSESEKTIHLLNLKANGQKALEPLMKGRPLGHLTNFQEIRGQPRRTGR